MHRISWSAAVRMRLLPMPVFKDEEIKWQTTARGVWYFKDGTTTVISFSHPAARVRDCYLYYALTDAIMEILK